MPGKKKTNYTLGRNSAKAGIDLVLPSGDTCLARRPGVQGLIAAGVLDNFDELTAIVQTVHIAPNSIAGRAPVTPAQVKSAGEALLADKEKLANVLWMVDRLVVFVVMEPAVWIDYQMKDEPDEEWAERQRKAAEDDAIAVRDIDLDDKMFLVDWAVGGTSELTSFREGSKKLVGDMATIEAL